VIYWATSAGNASSEQLIARYLRRTNRGLNVHFDYTFGKTLSNAWESSLSPRAQIADCRACDKGPNFGRSYSMRGTIRNFSSPTETQAMARISDASRRRDLRV
jgi:hypothetical protein